MMLEVAMTPVAIFFVCANSIILGIDCPSESTPMALLKVFSPQASAVAAAPLSVIREVDETLLRPITGNRS